MQDLHDTPTILKPSPKPFLSMFRGHRTRVRSVAATTITTTKRHIPKMSQYVSSGACRPSFFQRFDTNGDGVLDEAEQVVGRRIMTEMFLENHEHDIHLYGQGLSRKVRS